MLFTNTISAQVTLGFQGGEPADTWTFTSTGADATAQSQATNTANIVTGSFALVAGGNTSGGSCIDGGSGNGPDVARKFTFNPLSISSSSNSIRTLVFNWGNRFPVCVGTGWDAGENLVFTAYHDGVAQPLVTLATGNNNATFNIKTNQYTWSIPACVNQFSFELSVTTNRRDELLLIDNVKLTAPALNTPVPAPSPITGTSPMCIGGTQTLSIVATPNTTYTWSGLPAGASFTTPNGTAANSIGINWGTAAPGTYTISVIGSTTVCGVPTAGAPRTISIILTASPQITISGNTNICAGGSTQLSASGATTFAWDNGLGVGNNFTVNPVVTTTYNVVGSSGTCVSNASVTVTVSPAPLITIVSSANSVCPGGTVTLTASGATTYNWQPSPDLSALTGATVTATVTTQATYSVTGTVNGCQGAASKTISIDPAPIVNAGNDVTVCAGNPVTLTANGADNYVWDNGVINGTPFTPTQTQTYTVTGITNGGCTATDQVTVTIEDAPAASFSSDIQSGCLPLSVQFANTSTNGVTYDWDFGDGTSSTEAVPSHIFLDAGCKNISLKATSANGCTNTMTIPNYICNIPNPTAAFAINPNELDESNPQANMVNNSENATSYLWNFGDMATSTDESPSHTFAVIPAGNYIVTLVAYNADGCSDTARVILPFSESPVYYVPNAFTPDGNEMNQTFQPVFTSGINPYKYKLHIYNRWGEQIFESNDPKIGWDGVSVAGTIVPDGIYIWKIEFNLKNSDDRRSINGHVVLTR